MKNVYQKSLYNFLDWNSCMKKAKSARFSFNEISQNLFYLILEINNKQFTQRLIEKLLEKSKSNFLYYEIEWQVFFLTMKL